MTLPDTWLKPCWDAPSNVVALSTTRQGGGSRGVYAQANYALHVGDDKEQVLANRKTLLESSGARQIAWLNQVHGAEVTRANAALVATADAVISEQIGLACAVMTADCLPVLLCNQAGTQVAAIHCGWRSLAKNIIANTVATFDCPAHELIAWLGPAIGPSRFEVGAEVRQQFAQHTWFDESAFSVAPADKYLANIYQLASAALAACGVSAVSGGDYCTVSDKARFYSYRRDGQTGRMASLIYLR